MPARDEQLVNRMIEYCNEIEETLLYFGNDKQRYSSDFIMRNALSMPLQQIGELATHVSDGLISEHREIPWKQIKGMDYTKWQRQFFDAMAPGEFGKKALEYAKEHPYKGKAKIIARAITQQCTSLVF